MVSYTYQWLPKHTLVVSLVYAVWPWVPYLGLAHGSLWSRLFVLNILCAHDKDLLSFGFTHSMSIANQTKQLGYECRDVTTKLPSPHAEVTKVMEVAWQVSRERGHMNTLIWLVSVCLSVCLSVTDVTSFRNVYSGNETTRCTITRTLGTSLLTGSGRHGHLYCAIATVTGGLRRWTDDTRANKDCTSDEPDFIASYQGKAEV